MLNWMTTVWEFNLFSMFSVEIYRSCSYLYLTIQRENLWKTYMQILWACLKIDWWRFRPFLSEVRPGRRATWFNLKKQTLTHNGVFCGYKVVWSGYPAPDRVRTISMEMSARTWAEVWSTRVCRTLSPTKKGLLQTQVWLYQVILIIL
jgi:hypothetical protein